MRLIQKKWTITDISDLALPEGLTLAEKVLYWRKLNNASFLSEMLGTECGAHYDPFLLPDMSVACERIKRAYKGQERILIYGDYDVDGISATAILVDFFISLGMDVHYMIPDRVTEGYGMSASVIPEILSLSPQLVVTVDCGVANIEETSLLRNNNIDVIVTDHHEVKESLPDALAVICPKRSDNYFPFPHLCGAGIALKLVEALCRQDTFGYDNDYYYKYFDMAALATIADVVPLTGENRTIVKKGLMMINQSPRLGIGALLKVISTKQIKLSSTYLGFSVIPKINAAGRMGDASRAVELFLANSAADADRLAMQLLEENIRRQAIETSIFEEAVQQVNQEMRAGHDDLCTEIHSPIVVYGASWHPGVVGIVASRLVSMFHRSAIVLSGQSGTEGLIKGSARAYADDNILDAIIYAEDFLEQYGGHKKAAGLSLRESALGAFRNKLREFTASVGTRPSEPEVHIDGELLPEELSLRSWEELSALEPFGEGNREPRFFSRAARVISVQNIGDGRHVRLALSFDQNDGSSESVEAVAFNFDTHSISYRPGIVIDIAYELKRNEWRGNAKLSLQIIDSRNVDTGRLVEDKPDVLESLYRNNIGFKHIAAVAKLSIQELLPQKEDIRTIYQFLRARCAASYCVCDLPLLADRISIEYGVSIHAFALARVFDIFEQAGLMKQSRIRDMRVGFCLLFVDGKVKLENTETFRNIFSLGVHNEA